VSNLEWTCGCGHGVGEHEAHIMPSFRLESVIRASHGHCRHISFDRLGANPCRCPQYNTTVSAELWR
jgi:hypothetical protein